MKKFLILLSIILFGISASFSQDYTINVSWDDSECDCLGTNAENFFKITYEVVDIANDSIVIQPTNVTTPDATYGDINIGLSALEDYCGDEHEKNPSIKIYIWVWKMETYSGPPTECCFGRLEYGPLTCQDFENDILYLPTISLN